jgi:hypothetical protein
MFELLEFAYQGAANNQKDIKKKQPYLASKQF